MRTPFGQVRAIVRLPPQYAATAVENPAAVGAPSPRRAPLILTTAAPPACAPSAAIFQRHTCHWYSVRSNLAERRDGHVADNFGLLVKCPARSRHPNLYAGRAASSATSQQRSHAEEPLLHTVAPSSSSNSGQDNSEVDSPLAHSDSLPRRSSENEGENQQQGGGSGGSNSNRHNKARVSDSEYSYNVGLAIRTIVDELPHFFDTPGGLANTDIYSKHIVFRDPLHSLSFSGRSWYIGSALFLKQALVAYYTDILFDIVRVRQVREGDDDDVGGADGNTSAGGGVESTLYGLAIGGERQNMNPSASALKFANGSPYCMSALPWNIQFSGQGGVDDSLRRGNLYLYVRWVFEGTPRPHLIATTLVPTSSGTHGAGHGSQGPPGESVSAPRRSTYEGVFRYTISGQTGRIVEHYVQSIVPAPPLSRLITWWSNGGGGRGTGFGNDNGPGKPKQPIPEIL